MTTNKLNLNILINCSICGNDKPKYIKDICRSCYDKEKLRKRHLNSPMIPCECGCGTMIHSISLSSGKRVTRINGHCDGRKVPDYEAIIKNRKPREYKPVDKVRDQIITCLTCNQPNKKQYVTGMCEACYTRQKRWKKHINSPLKKCECKPSCNLMIHSIGPSGVLVNVEYTHMIGEGHPNFKGGSYPDKDGYIQTRVYGEHPNKDANGYVPEHRLVYEHYLSIMADEQVFLPDNIVVHHLNEIVDDNRLINLEAKTIADHVRGHLQGKSLPLPNKDTCCLLCDSKETYKNRVTGKPRWYRWEDRGYICKECYKNNLKILKNMRD